jgi:hypothetical protein
MVIYPKHRRSSAWLLADVVVALAVLLIALIPLAAAINQEMKLARIYHQQAIIMQVLDGEFEVLRKGEWRKYGPGQHFYHSNASALRQVPSGSFRLLIETNKLYLEWVPEKPQLTRYLREVTL